MFEQYVHDRVRLQRGRRRPRRQREVDRRPAPRRPRHRRRPGPGEPAGRPVGRRLDRRHADGMGHGPGSRADDRGPDERRAAAAGTRLPGAADRARAVRLRVGDQVAVRARADDVGVVRRLLGAARLGQGGPDPDPVAHRHAARQRHRGPGPGRRRRLGARTAASRRSRSASTAQWRDAELSTPISDCDLGPVAVPVGCRPAGTTMSVRATDGDGEVQEEIPSRPAPDGARGWHTITVFVD